MNQQSRAVRAQTSESLDSIGLCFPSTEVRTHQRLLNIRILFKVNHMKEEGDFIFHYLIVSTTGYNSRKQNYEIKGL